MNTRKRVGNFIDFLNYGVRRGDSNLKEHLIACKKNASYISKSSQNELNVVVKSSLKTFSQK